MDRAIEIHPCENYNPFEIEVTEPGYLRRVLVSVRPAGRIVAATPDAPPLTEMQEIPALMFEVDPTLRTKKRSFVWLPAATKMNYPGQLAFRDTYVDPMTGAPLILYEVIPSES